jgi:molybdopterin/thiamine biosynthesis adenylyltransferase
MHADQPDRASAPLRQNGAATTAEPCPSVSSSPPTKSVVLVGAGNIGSYAAEHIARMGGVGEFTIVDRDRFEAKNLTGQNITPADVGKAKALVLARRVRRINPSLTVRAIATEVQNVPLGCLRADGVLGAVDSREVRRYLGEATWHLNSPYIDAGVDPDGLLVRLNVYLPGPEGPCHQCGWTQSDYDALEQTYPCPGGSRTAAATNAPASLGGLAGSLLAIESAKLLTSATGQLLTGRELLLDAAWNNYSVTLQRRSPRCRFPHDIWTIERLPSPPGELSLAEALSMAGPARSDASVQTCQSLREAAVSLEVEGKVFIRTLSCATCGHSRQPLRLSHRLRASDRVCSVCPGKMVPITSDMVDRLDAAALPDSVLRRTLGGFGLRAGDVITVTGPFGDRHLEIGCAGKPKGHPAPADTQYGSCDAQPTFQTSSQTR